MRQKFILTLSSGFKCSLLSNFVLTPHFGSGQLKLDLQVLLLFTFCCNNETHRSILG